MKTNNNATDANIRIDRKTYKKLKVRAAREGLSLKALVATLA